MTPLDRALDALLTPLRAVPAETVPLCRALGAILGEPIVSPAALPTSAVALRAGWAVTAIETVGAAPYAPVFLASPPLAVRPGDSLPPGADAVAAHDAVTLVGVTELTVEATPGEGARRAGEDARAGEILRPAGARMRPLDAALAAAAGVAACAVRRPRVAILADPTAEAACAILAAVAASRGAVVAQRFETMLEPSALSDLAADLVVLVGLHDAGTAALMQAGRIIATGLGLRPGEETGCGFVGAGVPALLVPARPEAAFAASCCLLRPCLDRLTEAAAERPAYRVPLTRKIASAVGVAEIALLRATTEALEPLAVADLTLAALSAADAWLLVPADREGYAAGEVVEAFAL